MYGFTLVGIAAFRAGSGKSTVANALIHKAGFVHLPMAGPLKRIGTAVLIEAGIPSIDARRYLYHDREATIPLLGVTGRHLLQTLGTEWGRRQISPLIWLRLWRHQVESLRAQAARQGKNLKIVVDDVRFPNEADFIRRLGGYLWMIERPRTQEEVIRDLKRRFSPVQLLRHPQRLLPWKLLAPLHASEGGLNGYRRFDARIRNDGSINDLLGQAWEQLERLHVHPNAGEWGREGSAGACQVKPLPTETPR